MRGSRFCEIVETHEDLVLLCQETQCLYCKHFHGLNELTKVETCAAFPDEIPVKLFGNIFDHHDSYAGDRGIKFEFKNYPNPDAEKIQMYKSLVLPLLKIRAANYKEERYAYLDKFIPE